MKKIIAVLLTCLALTACSAPQEAIIPPTAEATEVTAAPTAAATESTVVPTEPQPVTLTLYIPNENADGFVETAVEVAAVNDTVVLEKLIEFGAIPENIVINSFEAADQTLNIDFNAAFLDHLLAQGTAGENMLIGSVVNTFLNAYGADSATLTVEGDILESGHVVYDFPLTATQ